MNDQKDRYITLFQGAMLTLNFAAVALLCVFIHVTTRKILARYDARTFLDGVATIPANPGNNLKICLFLMGILVLTFLLRQFMKELQNRWIVVTLILDMAVCGGVIFQLDFNYNGLLLLVFANVIAFVKDGKVKLFFVALAIGGYLVADYVV